MVKNTMKRMLSILLAVLMLFSLMPMQIFAEGEGSSEPKIEDFDTFMMYFAALEECAVEYSIQNPGKDPVELVIKYIRTGVDRYNTGSWQIMAGYEDADFANFITELETSANEGLPEEEKIYISALKNIENFYLPNGDYVDFGHMFGTMDITYHNNFSVNHADVAGWAGDIVDLISQSDRGGTTGTVEEMTEQILEKYLGKLTGEQECFSPTDILGDLDGFYLMEQIKSLEYERGMLYYIFSEYFTGDLTLEYRAEYLLKNRLDNISLRADLREKVYAEYTSNKVITTLEGTREFTTENLADLRKACCYAFADYICQLVGDFVDVVDNPYFTVFDTTTSNLAPGVTRQIKYATSADNKQMVYYLATADITRDDVNVYANYHDNDPSKGWAMQRVLDQANAAQNKYGNPDSEYYIPNYNVVVSTNGAGYNMSTGEPSGLFVMHGIEYKSINSNGFFGILKDGSAVIGTTEEYNTIYKGQVQEGIAAFGATLVKDGKIAVAKTENYYNDRASRTAVGITRTGKVVLMVLDGRQEPVSCGGSMQEIAQIMLEAGCINAVNLDGGGSTTFVSKEEGEEELSVTSNPSDGFARSVSTSLMIVSTAPSSTAFDHAVLDVENNTVTVNTQMKVTATAVSATGNVVDMPEGVTWGVSDEKWATITQDGVFTPLRDGPVDIYLYLGDEIIGSKKINIVTPDKIHFDKQTADAVYGATIKIPAILSYNGKKVLYNADDVIITLDNPSAGKVEGLTFVGDESSGIKVVKITVALKSNPETTAVFTVTLYNQGEATFDFDQAIGGDRQLAWDRTVSNSTTDDNSKYFIVDEDKDMVTSYIFAMDMTQIPIPEQLEDLTYMLPGSDMEDASAWSFLLQLAERVSVLTEVTPVLYFDKNFDVDYSKLTVLNEYFKLETTTFNEEENSLTLRLRWIDQTQAIDPATANPLCIVSGIKLTPKSDAAVNAESELAAVHTGRIGYKIYLRANALYSFAQKPENQEQFGLYPFVNPDLPSETGAYFESVYKEFSDEYTLITALKQGWYNEDGGFTYYKDGVKYTGVKPVEGYYYDFGTNGVNVGQTKYTGVFFDETIGLYRYAKLGVLESGWQTINGEWHYYNPSTQAAMEGKNKVDGVEFTFEATGRLVSGVWVTLAGGVRYYYGPAYYSEGWEIIDGERYYFESGYRITGYQYVSDYDAVNTRISKWYDFGTDGICRPIPDGIYKFENGEVYYIVDGHHKRGLYKVDGYYYFFDAPGSMITGQSYYVWETHCDLPADKTYYFDENGRMYVNGIFEIDGVLYYYKNGLGTKAGMVIVDGYYYFAGDYGEIATGDFYVWQGNGIVSEATYRFADDGKMLGIKVVDGVTVKGEIVEIDGKLYYYDTGVAKKAGIVIVDGYYYFAGDYGEIATGDFYVWKGNGIVPEATYKFADDGKMLGVKVVDGVTVTGEIIEIDGKLYYYDTGRAKKAGIVIVDGYYYFAGDYGEIATGSFYVWKGNGIVPDDTYRFADDGRMLGIKVVDGVTVKGEIALIDGQLYYYETGKTVSNAGLVKVDGIYYTVGAGGKVTATHTAGPEATCQNPQTCTECGIVLNPVTDHKYEATTVTVPTCTEQGYTTYICECGHSYKGDYVDATGHSHKTTVIPPTCTVQGYTIYTCHCGDTYVSDYVGVIPHTEGPDATCTEDQICTVCGTILNAATGHNYNAVVTAPTCTEKGYTTYTCACGDTYVADYVDVVAHNYKFAITPPTCTDRGYTIYACDCGDMYVGDYVDATGHTAGADATCTDDQVCTVCGDVLVEAHGHSYSDEWTVDVEPTHTTDGSKSHHCTVCGDKTDITVIEAYGYDVNGDGKAEITDYYYMKHLILGSAKYDEADIPRLDFNGDKKFDILDIIKYYKMLQETV